MPDPTTHGLTTHEAALRLASDGPNELEQRSRGGIGREVVRQLSHPLALLLWGAAVLSLIEGSAAFAIVVVMVVLFNAAFAVAQERRAMRALAALSAYLPPRTRVMRDGRVKVVPAREVVAGDLLLVAEGDRIAADGSLVEGSIEVDMAALTGESEPVAVTAGVAGADTAASGTMCVAGSATMVVTATGMRTRFGEIAALTNVVRSEASPLEHQVRHASAVIAAICICTGLAFIPLGATAGLSLADAAVFAVALIVANVPEGLLPTITLALAAGARSLAGARALVKRLSAVETLGSATVICTDKTGTLTENRLAVARAWVVDASGAHGAGPGDLRGCADGLVLCSDADPAHPVVDPTEQALLAEALRHGTDVDVRERSARRVRVFPFDADSRRMTTVSHDGNALRVDVKGAPESVLARSAAPPGVDDGAWRDAVGRAIAAGAREGLRMIALAQGTTHDAAADRSSIESNLQLRCLLGLADRIREDVPAAVAACHTAGIRVLVVTGDHPLTAHEIAQQAGIVGEDARVVTGDEVEALDDDALAELLARHGHMVFARTTPATKLRIARALQQEGQVVAMTGDGVNDAPALRQADIGVAMGRTGTDVAREAADVILADDNFASIVAAIREGRRVYANLRKFTVYVFAHATPEVVPLLLFALSGGAVPLGLTVAQILAIDLGTETLPALALGRERAEPDVMHLPPRPPTEQLLLPRMMLRAWLLLGGVSAALATSAFLAVLYADGWRYGDPTGPGTPLHGTWQQATTITFLSIVSCQLGTAYASRVERAGLRSVGVFTNTLLLWGIAFELVVSTCIVVIPPLQRVFGTTLPEPWQIAMIAPFGLVVWGADELWRWRRRRRLRRSV